MLHSLLSKSLWYVLMLRLWNLSAIAVKPVLQYVICRCRMSERSRWSNERISFSKTMSPHWIIDCVPTSDSDIRRIVERALDCAHLLPPVFLYSLVQMNPSRHICEHLFLTVVHHIF